MFSVCDVVDVSTALVYCYLTVCKILKEFMLMLKFNTKGHSLNGGTWSVIGNLNQSGTGELRLGLKAIL